MLAASAVHNAVHNAVNNAVNAENTACAGTEAYRRMHLASGRRAAVSPVAPAHGPGPGHPAGDLPARHRGLSDELRCRRSGAEPRSEEGT